MASTRPPLGLSLSKHEPLRVHEASIWLFCVSLCRLHAIGCVASSRLRIRTCGFPHCSLQDPGGSPLGWVVVKDLKKDPPAAE